ncbi:coiled-coil domain-containing protein 9 isoform X2 [Gymnodraco acuticeps]|uniref:Coiled-coil domain-containing protein 9 isoform X2 n=1 Tax=Gymnodraco acuticeps TaxID=8218 RepID=A0A6P8WJX6_GYMAC|nr:coiled-coil domain-containing protein 9 isoform X2 [Gymnodraco acuticeps]
MSSAVDLKTKEEKDAELDRRIEALRKKNEALVKRYQEIEEDKKKAEQEGIAVTTQRKPRPHEPEADRRKTDKENFTVTVDLSKQTGDKRVVNDWKPVTPRARKTSEESDAQRWPSDAQRWPSEGHRGPSEGHRGPNESHRGPSEGHRRGPGEGQRGQSDGHREPYDSPQGGPSEGQRRPNSEHSPQRKMGSGRMSRGGQRGGRQERREWEPRTPREGEPGEAGGPGRRGGGGRRGRGGEGRGRGGGEGGEGTPGGSPGGTPGGTPGGPDRKSKEWEEKRRQNIEKMNEEMEKIAEYERGQQADGDKPLRNFLDDPRRSGPVPDIDRKDGSRRHVRNWGGLDFDNVKTGGEMEKEWTSRRPGPKDSTDMTMSMTGRERAEYVRWKKEREEIDEERLARHRNATGQWKREWDAQKTENMFKEDPYVTSESSTTEQGSRRDDSKRPPQTPTFGDFMSQGRTPGPRGDRGRGKGRGQRASYSMHDNRWEGDKEEEEEKEKEDKTKREQRAKKNEKEAEKSNAPPTQKVEVKDGDGEDDDEEWEDASGGEDDEGSDSEQDSRGDEKKDVGREKQTKSKDNSPTPRSRPTSAGSPKEQRPLRPKVHIPPPTVQESPEGGKPLSPFLPLESHQPVSDWGEEMEMLSPRSSMGGESPLKPPSVEASPPQKKELEKEQEKEQEGQTERAEPQQEENTALDVSSPSEKSVIVSEPDSDPTESPAALPSDPAPSQVHEVTETVDEETPAALTKAEKLDSPPAALQAEQSSSGSPGEKDEDTTPAGREDAPAAETEESSQQTPSG